MLFYSAFSQRQLLAATITLNPERTYQTIKGWQATWWSSHLKDGKTNPAFEKYKDPLFDIVVNDIGINRLRIVLMSGNENPRDYFSEYRTGEIDYTIWRSHRYETINDNNDPFRINWDGFHFARLDEQIEKIAIPVKQRVENNGEKLFITARYVAYTRQGASDMRYEHTDPDEYAEFVLATYQHMQKKYGFVPDAWEVINEPDHKATHKVWNGEKKGGKYIGTAIMRAANRLKANGFTPRFIVPETKCVKNALPYLRNIISVPGALSYISDISYHRYCRRKITDEVLGQIAKASVKYGVDAMMDEWWHRKNNYNTLHQDLKLGRNSSWEQDTIVGIVKLDDTNPDNPKLIMPEQTKYFRQYFKFIRSGAIRIEAESDDGRFDPLAFINTDGRYVVVVKAITQGNLSIQGLPTATYGIKYTTKSEYDIDLDDVKVTQGQPLATSIPQVGVLTVYAK